MRGLRYGFGHFELRSVEKGVAKPSGLDHVRFPRVGPPDYSVGSA